jgi:hypothetical protein
MQPQNAARRSGWRVSCGRSLRRLGKAASPARACPPRCQPECALPLAPVGHPGPGPMGLAAAPVIRVARPGPGPAQGASPKWGFAGPRVHDTGPGILPSAPCLPDVGWRPEPQHPALRGRRQDAGSWRLLNRWLISGILPRPFSCAGPPSPAIKKGLQIPYKWKSARQGSRILPPPPTDARSCAGSIWVRRGASAALLTI